MTIPQPKKIDLSATLQRALDKAGSVSVIALENPDNSTTVKVTGSGFSETLHLKPPAGAEFTAVDITSQPLDGPNNA